MAKIIRKPVRASQQTYDLIIVGGGVYGSMLALEATQRRLRPLLVERDDFGEFTSFNSLRIIHGGFRYLQSLDLNRLRESGGERRWFLQNFPDLVKPLPCLMPLYGRRLRRPLILRLGLLAYEYLSRKRNIGVRPDRAIEAGRVVDAGQTQKLFPYVDTEGLQGGAIWHDAFVPDSQRLIMEILRWSCEYGATVLNYVEAVQLVKKNESVAGVIAIDHVSGKYHEFRANVVVNACGPWCRDLAKRFDRDEPALFKSMMAWNVIFNRKALSDYGLAVAAKNPGAQTYFLVPWKGKLFAGTGHAQWLKNGKNPIPSEEQIRRFCEDLNLAVPNLDIGQDEIIQIFPGLQPATKLGGTVFAKREVILNHANNGGPTGLYSISGVKLTTSRLVAEKTLDFIFPEKKGVDGIGTNTFRRPADERNGRGIFAFDWHPSPEDENWKDSLHSLIVEESVQHLDDLVLRRTSLGDNPKRALEIAPLICELFNWDHSRRRAEMKKLKSKFNKL